MKKIRVLFLNNHFQYSDGTVRALIGIVNSLDPKKFNITVKSLYKFDKNLKKELRNDIKSSKCFGFYFKGFSKILKLIPLKFLYNKFIGYNYDIEIAFQCDLPTLLIGNSYNKRALHVAWMHGYKLYPKEYQKCDKVVCVSKYCADRAKKEMKNRKDNIEFRYNLVDDNKIIEMANERVDLSLCKNKGPIFISVGRHSHEKGYIRLVKIFAKLREEGFNFHLILIGDGPEHSKIKHTVKELNMEDYISIIGEQNNPHKYTSKSDFFICSSYSEGYSTACTEAAILGIPIITTSVPGGEEIISECECGILTGKDDESLFNGIRKVLLNTKLISEYKNIMKRTSYKFCYESRKKEMNDLFNELYLCCINKSRKDNNE